MRTLPPCPSVSFVLRHIFFSLSFHLEQEKGTALPHIHKKAKQLSFINTAVSADTPF